MKHLVETLNVASVGEGELLIMSRCASMALVGVMVLSAVAMGDPVFLATQGRMLYRSDGITSESFMLGDDVTAMAVADDGTVWATSRSDNDSDGLFELYQLSDPLGPSPSLTLWGDFLEGMTPTLSFIDGVLYGHQQIIGQPLTDGRLVGIDQPTRSQRTIGETGLIGIPTAGMGYDSDNDILYAIAGRPDGYLYTVDYNLFGGADPSATMVGDLGVNNMRNHGAEFYDGTLYAAIQYFDGPLAIGSVDTVSGDFTQTMILAPPSTRPVGFAVLPEPSCLFLLGLGSIALLRHRRR